MSFASGPRVFVALKVLFIVNGEDVPVEAEPHLPLEWATRRALVLSHNTGRPFRDWETRDQYGCRMMKDEPIKVVGEHARLFLTLAVGVGG